MVKRLKWVDALWWIGLYFFWIVVFQKRAFTFSRTLTVQFCYLLFVAANFYLAIYISIPRFLYRKKYVIFGCVLVGAVAVSALLRVPLAMTLNRYAFPESVSRPGFFELFRDSLINIFIWVVCLVAGKLILDRFRFQQYIDGVEQEKLTAELAFLNAQFNPHFLFNSLHSIYGHIDKKNNAAREMLLTFSDMLRYQLYECNTDLIGIDKELAYIRNYVALQRARKDESLIVRLDIDEEVQGFPIAPLLFIAFIENAFKYASHCDDRENRIEISFQRYGDDLSFTAYNTREPEPVSQGMSRKGIGIANVKRRLALLYPEKHQLDIEDRDHSFSVRLKLFLK